MFRSHRKPGKLIAIAFALTLGWVVSAGASPAAADTTVSLTFLGGIDNQFQARQILANHNMDGTFYVNSGRIGGAGRLTWQQVNQLASDGNEIGGQTVDNPFLTGLAPAELQHQICDDRTALINRGFAPVSFAYPHGSADADAAAQAQAQACGYTSGRGDTGLGAFGQPAAETVPPQNPFLVRTRGTVGGSNDVAQLENWVIQAEQQGNAWLPMAFANICDPAVTPSCPASHITPTDLNTFLTWLQGRSLSGTTVKTVRKEMTGTDQPPPPPFQGLAVSLTFTSAIANQYAARQILADHGMDGTFYVNSGRVGLGGRLTWRQVHDLASDGNEIGGQSFNNPFLAGLDPVTLAHQICDDRTTLLQKGYSPTSFAWPHGSSDADAAAQAEVQQCGYTSGRGDTGLGGTGQPKAESIPPQNPYVVRTRGSIDQGDTLAEIETWIQQAQQGGSDWFPIAFSNVCDPATDASCPTSSITPSNLDALLDWIQTQQGNGVQVKTVRKVMTGTDQPTPPPLGGTTVSLTFDDAEADQINAYNAMHAHGMVGTFYVNSNYISLDGPPRRLTWAQVHTIANDGNEIAGHTLDHPHLTQLTPAEQQTEICQDRQNIINQGFPAPVSFAYPFGDHDATVEATVQGCGYTNARSVSGLGDVAGSVGLAETIPPQDKWVIHTRGSVDAVDTVDVVEQWIQQAEGVGDGWLPLVWHHICDPNDPNPINDMCESSHMTPSDFNQLMDFLAAERAAGRIQVRTVKDVMNNPVTPPNLDQTPPTTTIKCDNASCQAAYNHPISVSLAATDTGGSGLKEIRYTVDGTTPTGSSPVYTGPFTISGGTVDVKFRATDNFGNVEQLKTQHMVVDTIPPTSGALCDGAACTGPYNHTVNVTLPATDNPGGAGVKEVRYTTNGTDPTASSTLYSGPIPISTTTNVKFRAEDNVGNVETPVRSQQVVVDTQKPTSSITCDSVACGLGAFNHPVSVAMSGSDTGDAGFKGIHFTTDGSTPTAASPLYTTPFTVSSTTPIKFRAEDNAGNLEDVHTQQITIDNINPTSSIACDGAACLAGGYNHVVRVTLPASDTGGAGVKEIRYTLDGSTPTSSSTLYTANFFVGSTATVKWRAEDNAGNVETPVHTQLVLIDTAPPTTTVSCDGGPCSTGFNHPVNATLTASDGTGGGVKEIRYTTDGSAPTASSPLYTAPIPINATTTLRFRAQDNAGNTETPKSQQILIENQGPTSSILCDGAACSAGFYNHPVNATLSATDVGGSGVKNIRYTTDGSMPTASSPIYSAPIAVNSTSTIRFRAEDNAGNVESPVKSQLISIDTANPTSAIQCDGAACSPAYNHSVSATLSGNDTGGSGLKNIRFTTDGSTPTGSSPVYTSAIPLAATTTIKWRAEDNAGNLESPVNSQTITIDNTNPTSAIQCDGAACAPTFYNHPVSATLSGNDTGGAGLKNVRYTTDGSDPTASSPIYTSAIPVASTTTIKFRAEDNAGNVETPVNSQTISIDTANPTSAIQCDGAACQSFYNHSVSATLSGNDTGGSGLKNIRYTIDGSDPTGSSTLYGGPISLSATTTIKWRAEDNAGNVESPVNSKTITIDNATPQTTLACDGAACLPGGYAHVVRATLTSVGASGIPVSEIRYTIDGSTPTASSPLYTGDFFVDHTTTVKFFAKDIAGNVEPVQTQTVVIDIAPPVTQIQCDGGPCAPSYNHPVTATLSASDQGGGLLKEIRYTIDGSAPTASSPLYTGGIPISSTTTVKFRAEDQAGNVETPKSQTIVIDTADPTSAIQCDGAACASTFYNHPVSATLSGNDTGGAGLKNIRYTTDGSNPTASSAVYSGPINVGSTTTIKWRAEDNAGNVESPVHSQLISIDLLNPSSQIQCDGAACSAGGYNHPIDVTLSATDSGAAGVKEIRYTTDGSNPTAASSLYTGPVTINATTTIKWRAEDNAGNVETPVRSQQVLIENTAPTTQIQCDGAACSNGFYNHSVNATLSATDSGGSTVKNIRYTTDGSNPDSSSPVYSGPIPVASTTTIKFRAEDNAGNIETVRSQTISIDTENPSSAIQCDGAACAGTHYNHAVTATLSGIDSGASGIKNIRYTTDGSTPNGSSPTYTGTINVPVTTTIKWRAEDNAGNIESPVNSQTILIDTAKPTSSILCNGSACSSSHYGSAVSATLSGNDTGGSGVKEIRYTTDGSDPTSSSTLYTGAINVPVTTTIKWRAEDNAGNVESPVNSQLIKVDTTNPTSSILCDGAACLSSFYNHSVNASLAATDNGGGSGVKNIRYTTDGSNPDSSSPVYSGPIPVGSTTTIRFRAEDNAGNVESPVHSQTISIDTSGPTSQADCDGDPCAPSYNHPVDLGLSANDIGDSGVKEIRYTTDGSNPTAASQLYTGPIPVSATTTIKFRAEDNAGNVESPVNTQSIVIDAVAPTSSIQCAGAPCQPFYNHPINATLSANDTGGAGVKNIRYTTDGSTPTGSSPVYSGPLTVSSDTTIKFRAEDNAGNIESPVNSQTISFSNATPVSQASCDSGACASFYNHSVNVALSASADAGIKEIRYTTDGSAPTAASQLYTSPILVSGAGTNTLIRFRAEDNAGNVETPSKQQRIRIENGAPTTSIQCDGAACAPSYNHAVTATLDATDSGSSGVTSGVKEIRYTTDGSTPDASSPLYGGGIAVNSTRTIKFRAEDNAGNLESVKSQTIVIDTVDPTSAIQCDGTACSDGFYSDTVSVTLNGSDTGGSGLKNIRYTTNGSDPTGSSTVYSGAIPVSSTTTIKWRAEDNAGNLESPVNSQTVKVDTEGPSSQAQCDGGACASFYNHGVDVTLSATDAGAAGVKEIRYTTDGSAPDASSTLYTAPISVPLGPDTTIRFRAEDNGGNVESPSNSRTIRFDSNAPVSEIKCDGSACQPSYDHGIGVTLSATDSGGSGPKGIRYTTDGSNPTASSPLYSGPISVDSSTTIKWRAEDNAGNVEAPVNSQAIQITAPPNPIQPPELHLSSMQSMHNGSAKVTFSVNGPGTLQAADGSVAGASAVTAKKRAAKIKANSTTVAGAGNVTVTIVASKAGKKILKRKHKLTVPVHFTFTPANGSPVELTLKVKLRTRQK